MSSLAGKVIIITGAGRGLGRAMAERCGREGAHIAILEIDVELGRTSAAALAESGVEALFVVADIAQASQVENAVAQVIERWGRVDGLVNNAALAMGLGGQPFEVIAEDEWERVMTVNVKGLWLVCRAVTPHMRAAGHGKIVNIASDVPLWGGDTILRIPKSNTDERQQISDVAHRVVDIYRAGDKYVGEERVAFMHKALKEFEANGPYA